HWLMFIELAIVTGLSLHLLLKLYLKREEFFTSESDTRGTSDPHCQTA
ncbi:MAG: hypothetical protein JNG86_04320, partial [Verrucomicrobiaceae bacterium]|nr:hypothetical protein [Verrucomicrobiaceae bacterium]